MIIAVLSGKGGTGKTTVAASLASVIHGCQYVDADVEEPNGYLFLQPKITLSQEVKVMVPEVDDDQCNRCGECARACQFHALAVTPRRVLCFQELCHHCGACSLACKPQAIRERERTIGVIENDADECFLQGRLTIGEPSGTAIIAALKQRINPLRTAILDCAPGASCTVVQTISGSDFALLVTEPTPFGRHDLQIAVELTKMLGIRAGVILNKASQDDPWIQPYCIRENLPILLEIPFSRTIAEDYSRGILPVASSDLWRTRFTLLHWRIGQEVMA